MAKSLAKELTNLPFQIGDKAVYPAHGVGEVKSIESKEILGAKQTFYVLQILDSGMKIMVPTNNVNSVGLREVISDDEVDGVYDILKQRDVHIDNQTWNRRYREYMDKIKTGSLYDVAEVFRDLSLLKLTKDLSFGERKLFDTAQILLVKELSTAKKTDEKKIISELESFFAVENPENTDSPDN